MNQKGMSFILIILALFTHAAVFAIGYNLGKTHPVSQDKNLSRESSNKNISSESSHWNKYIGDKFTINYPNNWVINQPESPENGVSFYSNDYSANAAGLAAEGISVDFRIGWRGFSSDWGLKSREEVEWLGNKATLRVIKAEGNDLVLSTNIDGMDYEMVMFAPSDSVRDSNKELFLKVANSIILK